MTAPPTAMTAASAAAPKLAELPRSIPRHALALELPLTRGMSRSSALPLSLLVAACTPLVACGVGDNGPQTGQSLNGLQCSTSYTTQGKVLAVPAIPDNDGDGQPDIVGCWPAGTWQFTATATGGDGVDPECSSVPTVEPKYEVQVDYGCFPAGKSCAPDATPDNAGEYGFNVTLKTGPTLRNRLKYSSGGGGLCEGLFEFWADDGKSVWNFHPVLNADSSLAGQGEYQRYDQDVYSTF